MTVQTSAGSKIYIGTTAAASNQGQFESDTYDEIGEVVTIGEFGRTFQEITHTSINNRGTRKFKGSFDDGNLSLGLGRDPSGAGQAAVQEALDSDHDYNFKVELNDAGTDSGDEPTTMYFRAKVLSFTTNINDVNSVVQSTVGISIQSGTIIEIAAT